MFRLVVASLFVAAVVASPLGPSSSSEAQARIISQDADITPEGSYRYGYETENGISAQEQGALKQIGNDVGIAVQGQYAYTSNDGTPVQISYVSDELGFRAEGSAIPTAPPTPDAILRSLEYNAAHPEPQLRDQPKQY